MSSILSNNNSPIKYKDPGCPTISCTIGNTHVEKCLLDLGSSVNLLPLAVYRQLGLGDLKPTRVTLQLADRSVKVPQGIIEDVIIKVGEFYFPVDFIVLETQPVSSTKGQIPVILGRPFLATSNAIINCRNGSMKMSFGNMTADLNIFNFTNQHLESLEEDTREVCAIGTLVEEILEDYESDEKLEELFKDMSSEDMFEELNAISAKWEAKPEEIYLEPRTVAKPSIIEAPKLDLKPLPSTLKYAFLGENDTMPVIVASDLTLDQETQLVNLLKQHKEAIGWSMADLKGISPTIVQHQIHLEENVTPKRDFQRRLNPITKEAVRKEIIKWLDHGIIYPISDSPWVSPIHVVPKKSGVTVVKNESNELIPSRIQTGWRVCIDYRKLNEVTRKDHFPLPFIDQMLERIAGHKYYCFLDGYTG